MSDGEGLWLIRRDELKFSKLYGHWKELFKQSVKIFKKEPWETLLGPVEQKINLEDYLQALWIEFFQRCSDKIILEWVVAIFKERERKRYEEGELSKDFSDYEKLVEENKKWLEQKKKELENYPENYLDYMEWMRANVNNYKPFWMDNRYKNFSKILKGVVEQKIKDGASGLQGVLPDEIYNNEKKEMRLSGF